MREIQQALSVKSFGLEIPPGKIQRIPSVKTELEGGA